MNTNIASSFSSDTIAAVATAKGNAGIGVIRLSGPQSLTIATQVCGINLRPRYAHYCQFSSSQTVIDQGICIYFLAPYSFTGEDVVEFQAHGGAIVLNLLLEELIKLGARQAKPGEFSERAFLNDKIDLTQAEAIADLIDASSEAAAKNALNSLQGLFSKHIQQLVENVIALRVYVEAAIDFPEEEIDFLADPVVIKNLRQLNYDVTKTLQKAKQGSLLKEGVKIVIIGKPNAGKSSLLNALTQQKSAIVTDIQGTTRDIIREQILIDELPIQLIDTAGMRESADLIEQEGIRRASAETKNADIVILVNDVSSDSSNNFDQLVDNLKLEPKSPIKKNLYSIESKKIIIHNKCDLADINPNVCTNQGNHIVYLSATTGQGIELLKQVIKQVVEFETPESQEGLFSARLRHQHALKQAQQHLQHGLEQLQQHQAGELLAEELKACQHQLNTITGEFSSNDLLGEIFSSFCIGK